MEPRESGSVDRVDPEPVDRGSRQGVASQSFKTGRPGSRKTGPGRGDEKLACTISTKLTKAEDQRVRAYAAAQGYELSSFVRGTVLAAVEGKSLRPHSVMHLEVFVRTVEAWLELGDQFTVEKFRQICAMVTAKSNAPVKPVSNGLDKHAQT
jgi:hypothetical protein